MSFFESVPRPRSESAPSNEKLIQNFERSRIPLDPTFSSVYSDYSSDVARVEALEELHHTGTKQELLLGKVAEALIFDLLQKHELSNHLQFRATSLYDDFLHGVDVVVEPKNAHVQGLATLDITINQEDIKGKNRIDSDARNARPIGLEKKLERSKRYTDFIATFDPSNARELSGWISSGGLHQPRTQGNDFYFGDAERLFLMKYYKTPQTAPEPGKPGFVIGGPQTIISIDVSFVNRALQGDIRAQRVLADMAALEFMYCVEAEQKYLDLIVKKSSARNIFFDTHFAKIRAWSNIIQRSEIQSIIERITAEHQATREFREQLGYYAQTFRRVFGF